MPPNKIVTDAALKLGPRIRAERTVGAVTAVLIILLVTLFTRLLQLGDPTAHIDDQFYLYAGQSLLTGDLPYVEIWDRKPIGIFLIYAACAALGGNGVIQYQIVAGLFVFATALTIYAFGRHIATHQGALRAAILYPIIILPIGGGAGQTPIFYNLLVAVAALLTFRTVVGRQGSSLIAAYAGMGLIGLALVIKQTVVFEGALFGLFLAGSIYIRTRHVARTALTSLGLMASAAIPTLLAFAVYWQRGYIAEIWQATVISVFQKEPVTFADRMFGMPQFVKAIAVPFSATGFSLLTIVNDKGWTLTTSFFAAWCATAIVSFFAIPNFFDHYALPLALPFCVTMATALGGRFPGTPIFVAVLIAVGSTIDYIPHFASRFRADYPRLLADVRTSLRGGCLYVHFGPPQLYTDTGACRVTRFVFPDHLDTEVERSALPVKQDAEIERIFREQPPKLVVTGDRIFLLRNPQAAAILHRYLQCGYRPSHWYRLGWDRPVQIWVRQDRIFPSCKLS